jgi:NAD(P)-dependent dehydrogenase (short-subunit alcohol dehydrogenase family)
VGSRLEGKTAIVTGAGSDGVFLGCGEATSRLFAREGAQVLAVDVDGERAARTVATINDRGGTATAFTADIRSEAECAAAVEEAVSRFGGVDALVNNVGVAGPQRPTAELDLSDWNAGLALNVTGALLMSKHAIPELRRGGGVVLNLGSIEAKRPNGGLAAYASSKGAIEALTLQIAVEEGRNGVRANCIQPGRLVRPEHHQVRNENRSRNLLRTLGDAWDVAWAAVFLASDEARWITGVTLPIDAGYGVLPAELEGDADARPRPGPPAGA